jgi:hypothetical protein
MLVFIVSGTSWAGVVTDGNNITVECIGGGGPGRTSGYTGGGGGEYARSSVAYTSESTVNGIQIGVGGTPGADGTETHWNTDVVIAKGGLRGTLTTTGGAGGTGGTGDVTYNGGDGGPKLAGWNGGAGGGGAAGQDGAGVIGAQPIDNDGAIGGAGNNNTNGGGVGGTAGTSSVNGGTGGAGTNFDASHGSGGGGGGSGYGKNGGNGGLYGGGGGANGGAAPSGSGANGLIIITYTTAVAPTVTTQSGDLITMNSVRGNGNITATGGANATRRGFCYKLGTSGDPTVADSVAYDNGDFGTGAFTKSITGLLTGRAYRVRAYAVNSVGTSYGTTVQVYTLTNFLQMFQ